MLMKIAIVDDHILFRKGIISLIENIYTDCTVLFEADNGPELHQKLHPDQLPDIIIIDINMPDIDGFSSVHWLNKHYPQIKILIISTFNKDDSIIKLLKLGIKGYLSKEAKIEELSEALFQINSHGFYYTDFIAGKLVNFLQTDPEESNAIKSNAVKIMNDREKCFLQLACSELTYHEIADKMLLSPKTIDGYRNSLFEKLNVKSRVGLALFAVKHGLVNID